MSKNLFYYVNGRREWVMHSPCHATIQSDDSWVLLIHPLNGASWCLCVFLYVSVCVCVSACFFLISHFFPLDIVNNNNNWMTWTRGVLWPFLPLSKICWWMILSTKSKSCHSHSLLYNAYFYFGFFYIFNLLMGIIIQIYPRAPPFRRKTL